MLCFVVINSVFLNLLCVSIKAALRVTVPGIMQANPAYLPYAALSLCMPNALHVNTALHTSPIPITSLSTTSLPPHHWLYFSNSEKESLSPLWKETCRLKGCYSLAHRLVRRFEMQTVQNRSPGAIFSSLLLVPKTMNFMHKASQRLVKTAPYSVFKSWIIVQVKFPLQAVYKRLIEKKKKFWFSYK